MADAESAVLPVSVDEAQVNGEVAATSTGAGELAGATAGAGEAIEPGLTTAAAVGPCVVGLVPGRLANKIPLSAIAASAAAATTAIRKGPR